MVVWVNRWGEETELFFVLPTQRLSHNNQEAMHRGKRVFWNSSLPLMPCPHLLVGIVSGRLPLVGLAFFIFFSQQTLKIQVHCIHLLAKSDQKRSKTCGGICPLCPQ